MTVRTAILLLSLVAIALSQSSVKHEGNITLNEPLITNFGPWNLESEVTITINHTVPVIVCVVLQQFGAPNETQYSENVCTAFKNFTVSANHQSTFTFPAMIANYTVGVYFDLPDSITKDNHTSALVEISGAVCEDGFYYSSSAADMKCKEAVVIKGNDTFSQDFPGSATTFFTWEVPERVPVLTFKLTDEALDGQPEDYIIKARHNGNPDASVAADTNGTVTVNLPLPGLWVFAVYRSVATPGTAHVAVAGAPCVDRGTAGPGCAKIPEATNNVTLTLTAPTGLHSTYNFWVNASKDKAVWVSVTTFNQSFIPKLYVSKGQLPATDGSNAQISNCNRDYCTTVHSIFYNSSDFPAAGEDWFVTIQTVLMAGNVTFGVWFDSNCVAGCTTNNRGQCLADGTCECYLDFTGIDCAISEGLGAPYIVLIIIASLVVASAVVGFVAWAYMRRKRNDYETLS